MKMVNMEKRLHKAIEKDKSLPEEDRMFLDDLEAMKTLPLYIAVIRFKTTSYRMADRIIGHLERYTARMKLGKAGKESEAAYLSNIAAYQKEEDIKLMFC